MTREKLLSTSDQSDSPIRVRPCPTYCGVQSGPVRGVYSPGLPDSRPDRTPQRHLFRAQAWLRLRQRDPDRYERWLTSICDGGDYRAELEAQIADLVADGRDR